MARSYGDYVDQFVADLKTCGQQLSERNSLNLETVEGILQQLPDETDTQFAGRCIGVFHAYSFVALNFDSFKKLGFIECERVLTAELLSTLYMFFSGETPPSPQKVQLDLFINVVRQKQQEGNPPR